MIVIPEKRGNVHYFDVDDTLVIWANQSDPDAEGLLVITDNMGSVLARPHQPHINALIDAHKAGDVIVIWSQGGSEWAETVVKALNLESMVDVVMTKPTHLYDDLDPSIWLPNRTFLSPQ